MTLEVNITSQPGGDLALQVETVFIVTLDHRVSPTEFFPMRNRTFGRVGASSP